MTDEKGTDQEGQAALRILVVDDNKDVADSLAMLIEMWDYEVRVAYSGAEAVHTARTYRPDCILSDIGMPGFDGYRLAEELRQDQSFKATVLVAITAYSDDTRARAAGFDHHLVKPPSPSILEDVLRKVVDMTKRLKRAEEAAEQQEVVVGEVRDLMKEVRGDVKEIKEGLQQDVKQLKQELHEVKADVKEIKDELREGKEEKDKDGRLPRR